MNDETATAKPVIGRPAPGPGRAARLATRERCAEIQVGRRLLQGNLGADGFSIESYEFEVSNTVGWSRAFHVGSLGLCLNLEGQGFIGHKSELLHFEPRTVSFFFSGKVSLEASRAPNQRHRFINVGFSPRFLRERLSSFDGALHPLVESLVQGRCRRARLADIQHLTAEQESLALRLLEPHVFQGARSLWYQSKILELMSEFFFTRQDESELFCDRQKRVARARV